MAKRNGYNGAMNGQTARRRAYFLEIWLRADVLRFLSSVYMAAMADVSLTDLGM